MQREYTRSTMNTIADGHAGVRVETQVLDCATYLTSAAHQPFSYIGRIRINHFFIEAITTWGANAGQVRFLYNSEDPAVATQALCVKCASVTGLDRGLRVMYVGGVVGTSAVITATDCISDVICESPVIVGVRTGSGFLEYENEDTAVASGTMKVTLCYSPMSDGAKVTANF